MRKALLAALVMTSLTTSPIFAQSTSPPATSPSTRAPAPSSKPSQTEAQSDDQLFARFLTQHHKDGIAMCEAVIANGSREDVKALARRIMADEQRALDRLQAFAGKADQGQTPPRDPELERRMAQLRAAKGADADRQFLELMIAHQALGVMLSQAAAPHLTDTTLSGMARDMFGQDARYIGELQRLRETSQPAPARK